MELVTCVQVWPLLQMSLPWLGSVCGFREALRKAEAAGAVIQSLGGSLQMQLFLMVLIIACHFFSLTKAILIFSGLDALHHQHFLLLKVPKQSLFSVVQCCFSTFCLYSHKNSAFC